MSKLSRLFRSDIPNDLVLKFFQTIGVKTFQDFTWWSKDKLTQSVCQKLDSLLPELEPFYYPHKRFLIKREMNPVRYIQVLRQLARAKGMVLESKEHKDKNQNRKKITLYRLRTETSSILQILPEDKSKFTVVFE